MISDKHIQKKDIRLSVLNEQQSGKVTFGDWEFEGTFLNDDGKTPKNGIMKNSNLGLTIFYNLVNDKDVLIRIENKSGFVFPYIRVQKKEGNLFWNGIRIFTDTFGNEINRWTNSNHACICGLLCCGDYGDDSVVSGKYSPTDKRIMEINSKGMIYFNIDGQLFYSDNKVRKTTSRKSENETETDIGGTWGC